MLELLIINMSLFLLVLVGVALAMYVGGDNE